MPKISIIIPNYNNARYLNMAIQSVLAQTYKDYEIIIVDDGSTDNSRDIVARFGNAVRYIYQENQGLAGARNTGIQAAKGELIGLLDADDEWHSDYLEYMVGLSEKHPDAQVFYSMAQCMDVDGQDLPQFVGGPPVEPEKLYQVLLRANFIIPSTVTFRKKPVVESGCFDVSLRSCEDWDLWFHLLPEGRFLGSFKSLVRYRVHGNSLSTNLNGMHAAAKKVIEKHFGKEDGDPITWTPEKRRAYGGMYRYQCITLVQRQNNWDDCVPLMCKAFQIDPSLADDINFFYELALGTQPVGYRGVSALQDLEKNMRCLQQLINIAIVNIDRNTRRRVLGTAYYALGLVSYNLGKRSRFRKYFRRALAYRPQLVLNVDPVEKYFKSFIGRRGLEQIKKLVGHAS